MIQITFYCTWKFYARNLLLLSSHFPCVFPSAFLFQRKKKWNPGKYSPRWFCKSSCIVLISQMLFGTTVSNTQRQLFKDGLSLIIFSLSPATFHVQIQRFCGSEGSIVFAWLWLHAGQKKKKICRPSYLGEVGSRRLGMKDLE